MQSRLHAFRTCMSCVLQYNCLTFPCGTLLAEGLADEGCRFCAADVLGEALGAAAMGDGVLGHDAAAGGAALAGNLRRERRRGHTAPALPKGVPPFPHPGFRHHTSDQAIMRAGFTAAMPPFSAWRAPASWRLCERRNDQICPPAQQ